MSFRQRSAGRSCTRTTDRPRGRSPCNSVDRVGRPRGPPAGHPHTGARRRTGISQSAGTRRAREVTGSFAPVGPRGEEIEDAVTRRLDAGRDAGPDHGREHGAIDRRFELTPFLTRPRRFGMRPAAISGSAIVQSAPSRPTRSDFGIGRNPRRNVRRHEIVESLEAQLRRESRRAPESSSPRRRSKLSRRVGADRSSRSASKSTVAAARIDSLHHDAEMPPPAPVAASSRPSPGARGRWPSPSARSGSPSTHRAWRASGIGKRHRSRGAEKDGHPEKPGGATTTRRPSNTPTPSCSHGPVITANCSAGSRTRTPAASHADPASTTGRGHGDPAVAGLGAVAPRIEVALLFPPSAHRCARRDSGA